MKKQERFQKIVDYFQEHMPVAETELHYSNPYELIVAVILSAQCTDKRVNIITPSFFNKFPDARTLATFSPEEIYPYIKSCSYPNNKAKHLSGMAKKVIEEFDGIIPDNRDDLQKLPGVGRKTANVILSVAYEQPAMAVDTHVFRVSKRIGLTTNSKSPLDTELQLVRHFPEELLHKAHHWLILHGRYICIARNPKCQECGIREFCMYFNNTRK